MLFGRGYSLIGVASFFAQNMIDPDQNPDRSMILIHDINLTEIISRKHDSEQVHHRVFYFQNIFQIIIHKISRNISRNIL